MNDFKKLILFVVFFFLIIYNSYIHTTRFEAGLSGMVKIGRHTEFRRSAYSSYIYIN